MPNGDGFAYGCDMERNNEILRFLGSAQGPPQSDNNNKIFVTQHVNESTKKFCSLCMKYEFMFTR